MLERQTEQAIGWARERVPGTELLLEELERERGSGASLVAGGLAYRLFFWLVPLGLLLASVLSFWEREDEQSLEDAAKDFGLGAVATRAAMDAIERGGHNRWYLLGAGLVFTLWFAVGVVRAMRVAHYLAWRMPPEKLRRPIFAGTVFTALVLALIAASAWTAWAREQSGGEGLALTLLLLLLYIAAALWVMNLLPHRDAPWTALIPGAALVAVGVEVLHLVVALYLAPKLGRSSALYGSLGAATVVLLWLYITARLIVSAAFLNATLWERRAR